VDQIDPGSVAVSGGFGMEDNSAIMHDAAHGRWLMFRHPLRVIRAERLEEVLPALQQIEDLVGSHGFWAAGWISYEAAPAFDPALVVKKDASFPLLWFGVYNAPEAISLPTVQDHNFARSLAWDASVTPEAYRSAIARVKDCIARGETYQVNFTYRLTAPFTSDPWPYFLCLAQAQSALYSAFVNTEQWALCSASPELFFRLDGETLVSRPMKGTAPRGLLQPDDLAQSRWLHASEKNRAENVMIVDMVRNDMSRVAKVGTVSVPKLFEVEKYPTLWQMTSTVTAQTQAPVADILKALFPASSITGAPKRRTMDIIADLETTPRRVYTGSVGFFGPNRTVQFNVAIRTVLVDKVTQRAEYGVGGGIVWDSGDRSEFEECRTKALILTQRMPEFSLLETLLWTPDEGYFLLSYHLERMQQSALYFSFEIDMQEVRDKLALFSNTFEKAPYKVRVLVDKYGGVTCEREPLPSGPPAPKPRVCLAPSPVNSADPFLYHKTTNRAIYKSALESCPGYDDVILWNAKGEITESCFANVVAEIDGQLYTPPVSCGLLPGTFRAWLLDQGKTRERVILRDDLSRFPKVYLVNSVRKIREVLVGS
jgi:para-aminobenzoate synthetase / 4-amino-4-deoxychorismate lyase